VQYVLTVVLLPGPDDAAGTRHLGPTGQQRLDDHRSGQALCLRRERRRGFEGGFVIMDRFMTTFTIIIIFSSFSRILVVGSVYGVQKGLNVQVLEFFLHCRREFLLEMSKSLLSWSIRSVTHTLFRSSSLGS